MPLKVTVAFLRCQGRDELQTLALAFTDGALSLQPGVTERNFRRIRPGMTVTEVESLLGPYGLDRTGTPLKLAHRERDLELVARLQDERMIALWWEDEHGVAELYFGAGGRVWEALWQPGQRSGDGILARLRAWLGW